MQQQQRRRPQRPRKRPEKSQRPPRAGLIFLLKRRQLQASPLLDLWRLQCRLRSAELSQGESKGRTGHVVSNSPSIDSKPSAKRMNVAMFAFSSQNYISSRVRGTVNSL